MTDNRFRRAAAGWFYSIGTKLNLIFGAIVGLFVIFSLYNSYMLSEFNRVNDRLSSGYYSAARLKEAVIQCDSSINEYLRSGNRTNLSDFNVTAVHFRRELEALMTKQDNLETLYLTRSMEDAFDTYFSTCSLACFKYYGKDETYYTYMYQAQSINAYLRKYCDELLQILLENNRQTYRQMQERQAFFMMVNGVAIVGVLLLFGASIFYVNVSMTNPLNRLVLAARKIAAGNFDVKVSTSRSRSTVGVLFDAFDIMTRNIKSMMEHIRESAETEKNLLLEKQKNVEYQQMLSQANFLALQSQTNPHFLFNTLNSISRTVTLGMNDEAVKMIDAMSMLLRYNLNDAGKPVPLSQELRITQAYLKIQKYRFGERLCVEMDFDPALAETVAVPRFMIQPLVENAVIHGLEPREAGGAVKIKVRARGNCCVIKIMDNGAGIPAEVLTRIKASDPNLNTTESIGIYNTKKRVTLFTGDSSAFRLRSKAGRGTVIMIVVPMKKESPNV